ncbi:F-box/kelch-repeat protein At3g06240-like [Papaver somniferum]|uniref:F-box/kelch-repeat protein At3g06240-like n=1 Tax=Papaver somniferum TaxID=3469 RepID=UPI000E705BAD|nr:F-box/kelch-repeat protein At3g06240-like [Papaver somniferum]
MASETYKVIVSFEFKDDRFDEMPLPSFCDEYSEANLCSLGGSLCLLGSMHRGRIDVWEMKAYGVTESWEKNFTVEQATICKFFGHLIPLQFVNNDNVLLGYDTGLDFCLDMYDLKRGTSINLKAHDDFDSYSSTTSIYVESLVSLDSSTYVGQDDQSEGKESESDDDSEEEDSEDDDDSEEEEQGEEDIETKKERLRTWEKYGIPFMNIGDVNDGKEEEGEDYNSVEEDIKNKKKKAKLM